RLQAEAREDYDERQAIRERAITFFGESTAALYGDPGRLIIDLDENGLRFRVDIERAGRASSKWRSSPMTSCWPSFGLSETEAASHWCTTARCSTAWMSDKSLV